MFLPTKRPVQAELSDDDSEEGPSLGGWAEDRKRQQLLKKHRVRQAAAQLGRSYGEARLATTQGKCMGLIPWCAWVMILIA